MEHRAGKKYFLVILASPDPHFTKENYQNYQLIHYLCRTVGYIPVLRGFACHLVI